MNAILLVLILATPVAADWLQYRLEGGHVTGYAVARIPQVPSYGVVETPPVDWPAPASGCSAGAPEWTQVLTTDPLVLQVIPGLKLFRCQVIGTPAQVDAIVAEEIVKLEAAHQTSLGASGEALLTRIDRLCRQSVDPDCEAAQAAKTSVEGKGQRQDKAQVRAMAEALDALVTEAEAVKATFE